MVRVKVDHWRAQQRRGAGLKTMYAPAPALSTTATPDATSSSSTSRTVTGSGSCIDLTLDDDDDDDSEDDDEPLVALAVVPAPQPAASQAVESVGSDEGEDEDEAYPPLKLTGDGDGDDHESEEDEELPRRASDAAGRNDSTAAATPTADTTTTSAESAQRGEDADDEVLEDGEIFEEGAVIASPTRVKQAIALERMASRAAETAAPRQKKQKKRGKKKSKRKVEAMLMMAGGDASPGFERNTRHQPFLASPPPPPLHPPSAALHPVAPLDGAAAPLEPRRPEVGNMRMMFGSAPHPPLPLHPPPPGVHGAPFGMHGPRHGHAPIHGDAPFVPFPPFADDQILRVNRHGSVEMFNSVEYPRGGNGPPPPRHPPANPAAPLHMLGGFKYRVIPKAVRALQASDSTSGSSTSSSSSSNSNQSPDGKESAGDFDLDNLRAAALRTKRPSKVLEGEEKVDAASSDPAVEKSSTTVTTPMEGADEPLEATTPSIDDLRAEILRSMMVNKKKTAVRSTGNAAHVKQSNLEKEVPSNSSSGSVEQQRSEGAEARLVSTDSTIPPLSAPSAPSVPPAPPAPSSPPIPAPQAITSGSIRVASSSPPPVSAPIRVTEFSSLPVPASPPRFRPLTASTQSIVICLSPEDYSKSTKNGDTGQGGTSNSSNSTIQSAIEEMRKKIAEKEKLRNGSRVGEPAGDEAPKRSAPLSSSGSAMAQGSDKSGVDVTSSHAVMKSSLQAKIEEMKKNIAAKEMEKRGSSAPPSLTATASNSPRGGSPTNTAATANRSVSLPPTTKSGVDPQTASEAEKRVAGSVEAQAVTIVFGCCVLRSAGTNCSLLLLCVCAVVVAIAG